jgi:carboxyl-terminal processing protease
MLEGKPGTTVTLSVVRPRKADPDKLTLTRSITAPPPLAEQQYENSTILYLKPGVLTAARVLTRSPPGSRPMAKATRSSSTCATPPATTPSRACAWPTSSSSRAPSPPSRPEVPTQTFTADPAQFLSDSPLAVLVNRGTYGAAELTAAAIEDAKRGDVVGERTFGEGSVQKTIELPDGAALLLTVAKYEGPAGKKIQDEAVTPTLAVGRSIEDEDDEAAPTKGDEPLEKALQLLKAKAA